MSDKTNPFGPQKPKTNLGNMDLTHILNTLGDVGNERLDKLNQMGVLGDPIQPSGLDYLKTPEEVAETIRRHNASREAQNMMRNDPSIARNDALQLLGLADSQPTQAPQGPMLVNQTIAPDGNSGSGTILHNPTPVPPSPQPPKKPEVNPFEGMVDPQPPQPQSDPVPMIPGFTAPREAEAQPFQQSKPIVEQLPTLQDLQINALPPDTIFGDHQVQGLLPTAATMFDRTQAGLRDLIMPALFGPSNNGSATARAHERLRDLRARQANAGNTNPLN